MSDTRDHRQLLAIMFTDVVGYTAITERDEAAAVRVRDRHRSLVGTLVRQFDGELVDATGDESLSIFPSALRAVDCALALQEALRSEPELRVRVGIHLGDVLRRDGEVIGEGVNVAARIRPLAEPGGICVSEPVRQMVKSHAHVHARALGARALKNVGEAIPVYALSAAEPGARASRPRQWRPLALLAGATLAVGIGWLALGRATAPGDAPADEAAPPASAHADAPEPVLGVAVLPFDNLSDEAGSDYFAGGVYEDVLTQLARIEGLRVISRTSMQRIAERGLDVPEIGRRLGVTHVLEGSIRRAGGRVRVTVQLIDAAKDEHRWAENFDRTLDDIFAIQSEIARSIASQLETELTPAAAERIAAVPTTDLVAYDLYLQARELQRADVSVYTYRKVRDLLERALERDPEFLGAQVHLVHALGRLVHLNADPDGRFREESRARIEEMERRWPGRPETRYARAIYTYTVERDYARVVPMLEALLPEMPNDPEPLLFLAASYRRLRQFDLGLPISRKIIELDPESPLVALEEVNQLFGAGQLESALAKARRNAERFPDNTHTLWALARLSLAVAGDVPTYRATWERLDALHHGDGNQLDGSFGVWTVDQVRRFRLADTPVDALVARLDAQPDEGAPGFRPQQDLRAAQLLMLAGREAESRERAERALRAAAAAPGASAYPKLAHAALAHGACLAGDVQTFDRLRVEAEALEPAERLMNDIADGVLAVATAECGDPDVAWGTIQDLLRRSPWLTEWELVLDPAYRHAFAAVPEYQALVAEKLGTDG